MNCCYKVVAVAALSIKIGEARTQNGEWAASQRTDPKINGKLNFVLAHVTVFCVFFYAVVRSIVCLLVCLLCVWYLRYKQLTA